MSARRPPVRAVSSWLRLHVPERPSELVVVAPHGGRRSRPRRHGDSVNDLHTAEIALELAARLGAHAVVNDSLDRNVVDLNRIDHLTDRAPEFLSALTEAVDASVAQCGRAVVLLVHGWNATAACVDIGVGLRRRGDVLTGRYPTVSRTCFDETVARLERALASRSLGSAVGRRYPASGKNNATQLFSGRYIDHEHTDVRRTSELAAKGLVDAIQLELGIALRWPGRRRDDLLDALVETFGTGDVVQRAAPHVSIGVGDEDDRRGATPRPHWDLAPNVLGAAEQGGAESGYNVQAVVDGGSFGLFAGVEAVGVDAMAARLCLLSPDGPMYLTVGEGPWDGSPGGYSLDGLQWDATGEATWRLRFAGAMVEYPDHDAYLDLEAGLAGSRVVEANVELEFAATGNGDLRTLSGVVRIDGTTREVNGNAFVSRGARWQSRGGEGMQLRTVDDEGRPIEMRIECAQDEGFGEIVIDDPTSPIAAGRIIAAVPVWRDFPDGTRVRATFGTARYRLRAADGVRSEPTVDGLFDIVEIFAPGLPADFDA